jgi:beta-mannanase
MGGFNTYSWHPYSLVNGENSWNTDTIVVKHIIPSGALHQDFIKQLDKLAEFFLQLKNDKGESIPFIFRPWHEMGGSWFWWGDEFTNPEEYKQLFRFTIQYLVEEKGLANMLVCYSPNGGYQNAEEYLTWYPGDDIIDMLGVDIYDWKNQESWVQTTQENLLIMIQIAQEKKKLAALTETGSENIPNALWFTEKLGKALDHEMIKNHLSYVLFWRNDPKVHYFFSYKGHPSENDAKEFLSQSNIWLLEDYNNNK